MNHINPYTNAAAGPAISIVPLSLPSGTLFHSKLIHSRLSFSILPFLETIFIHGLSGVAENSNGVFPRLPLHVQYSYDDRSVVVVNSYYQAFSNLKVTAKVYNLDMTEKYSKEATLAVGEDSSTRVFTLPEMEGLNGMYFVDLRLENGERLQSRNFYWLPKQAETVDFENAPGAIR